MEIVSNPDLGQRTTLKMGGRAGLELKLTEDRDFEEIPAWMKKEGLHPLVIGGGSNLLVQDGELPLLLLKDCRDRQLQVIEREEETVLIVANTGCRLQFFLSWLQRKGLSGLEGLTGIPGCLGGAIAMNAGSYGRDMASAVTRVQIWSDRHGLFWLDEDQLSFAYRDFDSSHINATYWVITKVELKLSFGDKKRILDKMKENYRKKKQTQPVTAPTCGCVFKNPDSGTSAGYLLDRCGFKGYAHGRVAFSGLHANFLINLGRGSSEQALELVRLAREKVYKDFNIDLQTEVRIIGA